MGHLHVQSAGFFGWGGTRLGAVEAGRANPLQEHPLLG